VLVLVLPLLLPLLVLVPFLNDFDLTTMEQIKYDHSINKESNSEITILCDLFLFPLGVVELKVDVGVDKDEDDDDSLDKQDEVEEKKLLFRLL
jgi:hypothetical protein